MNNLIYQTTVFSVESRPNYSKLANGYFRLETIKNLRLVDNCGIIRNIRSEFKLRQKNIANLLRSLERDVGRWENGERAIPYKKILILLKRFNQPNEKIKDCLFSLGDHHGGSKISLPLKPEEFILSKYLIPMGLYRVYVVKNIPQNIRNYTIKNFRIDKSGFAKLNLLTIYSELLNKFLKTFYIYERRYKLNFPLSTEISKWKSINLVKAVIVPSLLSDGGGKPRNRVCFFGASENLHRIWSDAIFYSYHLYPSSYLLPHASIYSTTHIFPEKIIKQLKKLSPTFKTSPYKESVRSYLKAPQPTIKYLYDAKKLEQQIAIRIWSSAEGSIGIYLDKKTGLIMPLFKIACAHPTLIKELKFICKLHKINLHLRKEPKNWSGIGCLFTQAINSTINFLKIGGFIDNVLIAKSRSKYFGGLNKQDVLLGVLEFILRQRKKNRYKVKKQVEAYRLIRKIVLKKDFKNKEYYVNIFGKDFDNWSFRRNRCL